MSDSVPTFAGWYPDPYTGGTKYSDGKRWTGDTRPRRKPLAAAAANRVRGVMLIIFGVLSVLSSPGAFSEGAENPVATFFLMIVLGLAALPAGVYMLRGQGPTTKAVEARLAAERMAEAAERKTEAAERKAEAERKAGLKASILRRIGGRDPAPWVSVNVAAPTRNDTAAVAQINALANPETAKALQNLQNLLYTQAITEDEYQAVKDRLLGSQ
jgi:Protein of unknown function (DUF2510)